MLLWLLLLHQSIGEQGQGKRGFTMVQNQRHKKEKGCCIESRKVHRLEDYFFYIRYDKRGKLDHKRTNEREFN
jgi:hypothetical protein